MSDELCTKFFFLRKQNIYSSRCEVYYTSLGAHICHFCADLRDLWLLCINKAINLEIRCGPPPSSAAAAEKINNKNGVMVTERSTMSTISPQVARGGCHLERRRKTAERPRTRQGDTRPLGEVANCRRSARENRAEVAAALWWERSIHLFQ